MTTRRRPLVGLPADCKSLDGRPVHTLGDKYARAVAQAAGAVPVVLPALGADLDLAALLDSLDGVVLTGSVSNVHPSRYGAGASDAAEPYDLARDDLTFPLIEAVLAAGVPLFAICRGMQELNVALGGTLHARLHEQPGRLDHRAPASDDPDVRYGAAHALQVREGGLLHGLLEVTEVQVNSIHGQGIDRLADGLAVEGEAPDGTIEAVSVPGAHGFALGVQWHPEYRATDNSVSVTLFRAFGDAAAERAASR